MDTVQDTLNDLKALFNNAPDLKVAIRKYIDENAGLKKQVEEFMKEKGAALKARLVENAKRNKWCESGESHHSDVCRRSERYCLPAER